ncbi:hypothetical protein PISMIDRAFT_682033 [Pisolithus microcarpus 441]|uniref:Uncharacterized protein n=1 Tax=Pisolithus microcarpus 441 TaxID=765257 RepID=A0A0C9YVK0_9AGAM|nr:hypothetical protein BKA83DRAFT_682033 [Pisolithus microcarpus]KIK20826.1 hypothetical protein PISMIDRAFT_682033 [Pisolithus microcarpus 441]
MQHSISTYNVCFVPGCVGGFCAFALGNEGTTSSRKDNAHAPPYNLRTNHPQMVGTKSQQLGRCVPVTRASARLSEGVMISEI